ncbi:MAG: hypothetical protein ACREN2_02060, partial [Candidatus Dormibacteria bacterium]
PAPAADGSTLERWRGEWPALIEAVTRVDTMLAGVLRDCRPVEANAGSLVVGANHRFHMDTISKPEKSAVIASAASNIAGEPIAIETRFTAETSVEPAETPGAVSEVTHAVLQTFGGSRVTATRLREDRRSPRTRPG